MRQEQIRRNTLRTARSEPQSAQDSKGKADSRAEHDGRSAALLARLAGQDD